ncbi:MAG: hypothetical protein HY769_02155 [Candidatus Stahlbacteria bacterium]|nr:hypothetical protein [Candidatus Stahlbacteria bacterium]
MYNGIFNVLNFAPPERDWSLSPTSVGGFAPKGKQGTALHSLAICLACFPYIEEQEYTWQDIPPLT